MKCSYFMYSSKGIETGKAAERPGMEGAREASMAEETQGSTTKETQSGC